MMNISKIKKVLSLAAVVIAFVLVSGYFSEVSAQQGRDPFSKNPVYKKQQQQPSSPKTTTNNPNPGNTGNTGTTPTKPTPVKPKGPMVVAPPTIEARIDYFKRIREQAAMNGQELPKVTSVLLVDEMSVTGIFKTPRGYAAMVEATPIKLSYTIYPGEKFFDGQLVAVEENRLIFRKVTKWSNNKFISSVENKPLREYSLQQNLQGTAPANEQYEPPQEMKRPEAANNNGSETNVAPVGPIVSPLDEMNNQPVEDEKEKAERNKKGKKRASKTKKRS